MADRSRMNREVHVRVCEELEVKLLRLTRPLDERKSKLRLALPVANKTAEEVVCGINTLLGVFKDWVQTLTFDNGKEFAKHEEVANTLGCETYFAKPYHSWERGQNENANRLLRQYFPKQ